MKEENIRKKYQRDDENDKRGTNGGAIDNFIKMLEAHKESTDKNIRSIAENFEYFDILAPNFIIFECEDDKCGFMPVFKALQIGKNTSKLISSHEFGHAVLAVTSNTQVPKDYENIILRAKEYALSPENKEFFKSYVEYLSKNGGDNRTEGEKGPVSDIISSIFQERGLRIGHFDNACIFPSSHSRSYYFDEEKGKMKEQAVFDEDFANFYALKANNCEKEISILRKLFGNEFVQTLDNEIEKAANILEKVASKENQEKNSDTMDKIKSAIIGERQENIISIQEPDKENENKRNEGEIK
ncbi:MAG: hypothetical protein HFJ17_04075 [Clostridia bacterium]|nr:hypothetical protein [Clostridia bacterium]